MICLRFIYIELLNFLKPSIKISSEIGQVKLVAIDGKLIYLLSG